MDLLEAKRQCHNLHQVTFADNTIVTFRLLNWKEYEYFYVRYRQGALDQSDDTLFHCCVLNIENNDELNNLKAGVIYTITNVILSLSGPSSLDQWQTAIEGARKDMLPTMSSQIELMICGVFPAYKPEDIWNMDWPMIMHRLAQAEHILLQTKQIDKPLTFSKGKDGKSIVGDLIKDAKRIRQVDRSRPTDAQHAVGRESNWSKVRD